MITFNDILESAGVAVATVHLVRHQDSRIGDGGIYAVWKSPGGQSLVEGYQEIQAPGVFQVGEFVASFVVTPPPRSETLFIGLYRVLDVSKCAPGYKSPILELDATDDYQYRMEYDDRLDEYKERLSIDWGRGRAWHQSAARQSKPVREIRDQDEQPFPGFSKFCKDIDDIADLPASWKERLSEVKGIYVLVDKVTGKQYVGSAKGEESFFGRFMDYARTGDGGNVELKQHKGARYQAGLLELVDQSLPDHKIEEIESWWKRKLMSREHGWNRN